MKMKELRQLLNELPKAFEDVDVGVWDHECDGSIEMKDILLLCRRGQKMLVTFTGYNDPSSYNKHSVLARKPIPWWSRSKLLKFLGTKIEFTSRDSEETRNKASCFLNDLRKAVKELYGMKISKVSKDRYGFDTNAIMTPTGSVAMGHSNSSEAEHIIIRFSPNNDKDENWYFSFSLSNAARIRHLLNELHEQGIIPTTELKTREVKE